MDYQELKSVINSSNNIVFFGGAGISTESSIPDFRSEVGLYKTKNNFSYPPEVMLSHSFFTSNTEDFFDFYRTKMIYKDAKPNSAHYALSELEKQGKLRAIITQNIDGLHQLAGSKNVLELHGSIHRNYCMKCGKSFDLNYIISSKTIIPKCDLCTETIKPDVVLYEESLDMNILNTSINYIKNADVLIVGGTSLVVYPAAGLIDYFQGNKLILINKSSTPYDNKADIVIHDSIGVTLQSIL
ncbi:NAD-dependent protein deacylase [Clostridium magnum]|uniref:NAD-dependent protein deacetylase n=1 Tax=Clostridium magnum DSM 2767 TaxID=1121326 RepID=A0A162RI84_9CLOT|nr:NAD-dependent protein deacylase [Clostridium magnum]KZL89940.1 NAD-dependent protein deacetylase [Clostridium magnum DSM 2767]SHJ33563.1 NAD-dependent deacetylase [Clostridium magnum DSM 2767]